MPGKAIGTILNYGFAGLVSRTPDQIISSKPVKGTGKIYFGEPVIQNTDNTYSSVRDVTIAAANFAGVAVGVIKQNNAYPSTTDGTAGFYDESEPAGVLERGIMAVKAHGTITAGGAVYVRKTLNGAFPDEVVGSFRGEADSSNTVEITNCSWFTGEKDANGIAELRVKTINQ